MSMLQEVLDSLANELDPINTQARWPEEYINRKTGRYYKPTSEAQKRSVLDMDTPYILIKGGEGSGKSVAGIIKTLDNLRRGMDGIMVCPDLPFFKRSLWPEFQRWCPKEAVHESDRYKLNQYWTPTKPFSMTFYSESGKMCTLHCGGIKEPAYWEGINAGFAHIDEGSKMNDEVAFTTLMGRVRDEGPWVPQIYITTTPSYKGSWLWRYFGPVQENDELESFKERSKTYTLLTLDNSDNLSQGYIERRSSGLTEVERLRLMEAEWVDEDDDKHFLESYQWWERLGIDEKPPLNRNTPLVMGLDGASSRDHFAVVTVTVVDGVIQVMTTKVFKPKKSQKLQFASTDEQKEEYSSSTLAQLYPEDYIVYMCENFNVVCVVYDPHQIADMCRRLAREGVAWFLEFSQNAPRVKADQQLYDAIINKKLVHYNNAVLNEHVKNANKINTDDRKLRIVKRTDSLKIDAVIALSMASWQALYLNLEEA